MIEVTVHYLTGEPAIEHSHFLRAKTITWSMADPELILIQAGDMELIVPRERLVKMFVDRREAKEGEDQ